MYIFFVGCTGFGSHQESEFKRKNGEKHSIVRLFINPETKIILKIGADLRLNRRPNNGGRPAFMVSIVDVFCGLFNA